MDLTLINSILTNRCIDIYHNEKINRIKSKRQKLEHINNPLFVLLKQQQDNLLFR